MAEETVRGPCGGGPWQILNLTRRRPRAEEVRSPTWTGGVESFTGRGGVESPMGRVPPGEVVWRVTPGQMV